MATGLSLRNGIWQMRYRYKDDIGKWRDAEKSTGLPERGNKRKAQEMRNKWIPEVQKKFAQSQRTQDALFIPSMAQWLTDTMPNMVRPNTLTNYKLCFEKHIRPYKPFAKVKLAEVSGMLLQGYYNTKLKEGLSANTVLKHHSHIHKFFAYAVKLDLLDSNPADKVTLPRKRRSQIGQVYSAGQIQALRALFMGDPLQDVVYLTSVYALRRSEIAGLKWDAISFDAGRLTIQHTAVTSSGTVLYVDNTKSAASRRTLPLTPDVTKYLLNLKERQKANKALFGSEYVDSAYVCCMLDGNPIKPEYISRHFSLILARSTLPKIRFHDLRHSVATLLHDSKSDIKDIQAWLGHSDIATTADVYAHIFFKNKIDMAERLDAALHSASDDKPATSLRDICGMLTE